MNGARPTPGSRARTPEEKDPFMNPAESFEMLIEENQVKRKCVDQKRDGPVRYAFNLI